jgi:PAS domain S-box-containing protein
MDGSRASLFDQGSRIAALMDVVEGLSQEGDLPSLCAILLQLLADRAGYGRAEIWFYEAFPCGGQAYYGEREAGERLWGRDALAAATSYALFGLQPVGIDSKRAVIRKAGSAGEVDWLTVPLFTPADEYIGQLCAVVQSDRVSDGELAAWRWVADAFSAIYALKQKEQSLQERQSFVWRVIDYIPHFIYVKDEQSRFLMVNSNLAQENNVVHPREMIGKTDFDYYDISLAQKYYDDEQELIRTGQPLINIEERCRDRYGNERWVLTTKIPVCDEAGHFVCLVGIGANITERKYAEDRLLESEERFRVITEAANDGIVICSSDGQIEYVNRAASELFGYQEDELRALNLDALLDNIRYPSGTKDTYIQMGRRKDGTLFPVELSDSEVQIQGSPRKISIIRDVSEREEVLRDIRKLTAAIEESHDGFIISNEYGMITYVNPGYEWITGYRKEEVVNLRWITVQDHGPEAPISYFELDLRREQNWKILRKVTRRDGTAYDEEVSTFPVYTDAGDICNYVTIIRDVTEERSMVAELRQAQKLESVGQLAAGIAHEINTPIQFVGDNILFLKDAIEELLRLQAVELDLLAAVKEGHTNEDLLNRVSRAFEQVELDYLKEEVPAAIEQSMEGVQRVSSIVRAMKEFSHPGAVEVMPADLNEAIQTTVTVARNEWKYVADLKLELSPNLPLLPCIISEVNQVMLNLIVNARDAIADKVGESGEKGIITIQTIPLPDRVEIRVSDTGIGVPEKVRNQIFDPFFTTKEVGKGSGQGLSIAHGVIVKKHGGEFTFETETGVGSTFIIRLPLNAK